MYLRHTRKGCVAICATVALHDWRRCATATGPGKRNSDGKGPLLPAQELCRISVQPSLSDSGTAFALRVVVKMMLLRACRDLSLATGPLPSRECRRADCSRAPLRGRTRSMKIAAIPVLGTRVSPNILLSEEVLIVVLAGEDHSAADPHRHIPLLREYLAGCVRRAPYRRTDLRRHRSASSGSISRPWASAW